jgi:hypothetical protein
MNLTMAKAPENPKDFPLNRNIGALVESDNILILSFP